MINYELSNINLIGFIFILTMSVLILVLPRRFAVLPLIMTACFITLGQVVNVASLNFMAFRIIIFFGLVRIIIRKEVFALRLHTIDKVIIAYVITSATAYILLRNGNSAAFISQFGFVYNSLFLYFIFRTLIRDFEDIKLTFKMLALVAVLLALAMINEKATGQNLFSVFGGLPEFTMSREGRLRCQGAFAHPILAGTFGATSLPFMLALWFQGGRGKWIAGIGIISVTIITITAASSGPVVTYIFVIIGMAMWLMRDYMRAVRWCILLSLIVLHIVMKASVWALIGKMSGLIGGTGWHRVMLIDAAINHFDEWWLMGVEYTRHWMPTGVTWSKDQTDITNHFIAVGIHGGLVSLVLFIVIIIFCFKNIGIKLKEISSAEFPMKFTLWCMGVALVGHLVSFTSVYYFDQIIILWYLILALITTVSMIPSKTLLTNSPVDLPNPYRKPSS